MDTLELLTNYYSSYDEEGRLLSRHGSVEYLTTMRYIEKYLKPGDKIAEIGAATGRYSHTLARRGHQVDAVELVEHNIRIFREKTQPGEAVTICQGDARDLHMLRTDTYDIFGMLMKIGGWEKYSGNKTGVLRRGIYGPQRCYVRKV